MPNADQQKSGAARRNAALRKIRLSKHLPVQIKAAIQHILDHLGPQTGYEFAWPSASRIAQLMGRSVRTVRWYLKVIKALGIFRYHHLRPTAAIEYSQKKYGFTPRLERCSCQAPILFEPNHSHPLWDKTKSVPLEVDREMGEIANRTVAKRGVKSTSRLASDPRRRPSKPVKSAHQYCLERCREQLRLTLERVATYPSSNDEEQHFDHFEDRFDDVANDRFDDVASDRAGDVANNTQVLEKKVRSSESSTLPFSKL